MAEMVMMPKKDYEDICNSVRSKTGGTELLKSGDIPAQIEGISGGGEKILYMDAELLNAGGAYPADANDYTTAVIPAEATYVSLDVFDNLPNVTKVEIYGNCEFELYTESFGKTSFYYNALTVTGRIKEITVSERTDALPDYLSYKNSRIERVHIDCPTLGRDMFNGNYTLFDAVIHADSIPKYTFNSCEGLRNIELSGITSIGMYAFYGCSRLKTINIPTGVTTIETNAFSNCLKLSSVVIPNTVESIQPYAFSSCYSLASITIPDSVIFMGSGAIYSATVIRGHAGSYAETWATENGYTFEVIE